MKGKAFPEEENQEVKETTTFLRTKRSYSWFLCAWLLISGFLFNIPMSPGRYQELDLFIKVLRLLCPNLTDASIHGENNGFFRRLLG